MHSLLAVAQLIEDSRIGTAIAESRYLWAVFEGAHLLSLAVSFGLIVLTDLRLIGLIMSGIPVLRVVSQIRPFMLWGFALTFVSGALVFWSEAATVMASPLWTTKIVLIVLAALNAAYFEWVIAKRPDVTDSDAPPPRALRLAGIASLCLWSMVIVCGRLLAYLPR